MNTQIRYSVLVTGLGTFVGAVSVIQAIVVNEIEIEFGSISQIIFIGDGYKLYLNGGSTILYERDGIFGVLAMVVEGLKNPIRIEMQSVHDLHLIN